MRTLPGVAVLAATSVLAAASVRADPDDLVGRPLVLAHDAVELRLTAEINAQVHSFGRPLSLAPDAWWGVSPRLTIGITHSDLSVDQIATRASLCVRETAHTPCDDLYHGGGVDLRFAALSGQFALAPRARVLVRDLDPFKPAVTLGALMRWTHGRFAIASDPYVRLPLANAALGNRAALVVPLWLAVQPAAGWAVALHTGFDSDLAVVRDGWHGPIAFDVTTRVTAAVELALEAGWASLFGPQLDVKHATVMVGASWRI